MKKDEKAAWNSFKNVVENFLENQKSKNYKQLVTTLVKNYEKLGKLMNLQLHFLDSHFDYFHENLGDCNKEQGERFYQDIKRMERRCQGRWDINMMADYCWTIKRDMSLNKQKRTSASIKRSFESKKACNS